eukprot:427458-Amorphochlora_amoeboformis.AAC.1
MSTGEGRTSSEYVQAYYRFGEALIDQSKKLLDLKQERSENHKPDGDHVKSDPNRNTYVRIDDAYDQMEKDE